ncbi:hypothetical protein LPUS_10664 [Lasallia pustulata]|uniref:Integrase zinc-binding domain-containing protein n=1 Tax=Lasallia pustulata TaxID=136370 RepID=A0A1W5DA15_9LECA|nr:hypothetical protein LPUS_10664 [Lasallia pustulata]
MDVRRPGHPEAQHRSIEDSAADADAMDIDDTVDNDPIGLQIEAGASNETVEAFWLVATRTPIGGRGHGLYKDVYRRTQTCNLCRTVSRQFGTMKMANAVPGTANMATNMAATMASIWSRWQEIDDVVYYNGKIYVLQNTALRNAVISRYHDDIFAGHFGKSRTAKLM